MSLDTVVEINNALIGYSEHTILSEVHLKINKGEFIYLIGKTGAGKSSLIKTLIGELPLIEGEGTVAGFNLRNIKQNKIPFLRRKVSVIFQDFQLLTDRTVHENLAFVLKATGWKKKLDIQERISDVLDKVNLRHKEFKMPHQLSGGEQQRIGIARALLNDPEIILADEPTGNLDPETSEEIMNLLISISRTGRAVIMATHNYGILKKFPFRTIKCEYGKLSEIEDSETVIDFDSLNF
ncbi:MAG: ATP-binding cassette domain-containing protein [Bacteroidales bacterium]|nr:ATP-binding cassette domain-containing protein [Bacteroidales bacterium]